MTTEQPTMHCPKCGRQEPDYDGMGLAYCETCGYCDHRAADYLDGELTCCMCGEALESVKEPTSS